MAEKPAVRPDIAVGEALRAVARDILAEARAVLNDQEKPDATAVHEFRKAMKRWRALLRLLEPFLGDDGQRLRAQARDFAREVAGARDAQSAIEALEDLIGDKVPLSARTVASIRGRLDEKRLSAEAAQLTQALRARFIIALDAAEAEVAAWPLEIAFAELARELSDAYKLARDDAPDGDWREVDAEVLHDLRRRVVAHRYQMELVEPLWPKFGKLWVAEAQRLRDRLGAFQDLSVLLGFTAPHGALAPWRSRLVPLILARRAKHARAAQRIAGRLFAERPRAFRKRIEALWKSGKR
ncbi:MAG TPA: CHAD domain-containing protein [Xanthobacteraceae bacterium]|nr:CHAD domain-containing protein [Xanthobacteraceae bacterium]